MKKIFVIAALALTLAACNKQDIQPVDNGGMITLTAQLAPKSAATKAISENGNTLKADWVAGETLAILYELSGEKKSSTATVTSVDAAGTATITFTVEAGTPDNTACTVIYPSEAAADDADNLRSDFELIGNQLGVLHSGLDVRITEGTISPVNPDAGLVLTTPMTLRYAIVKFTLQNTEGSPLSAKSLAVTIGTKAFVATPTSAASEFFLALPPVSNGTLTFSVPGNEGTSSYRSSKANLTIKNGKYYRSTVQMAVQSSDPDCVEMGDGLKWATKNVGASAPHEYGDYFAWGEAEPYYQSGYSEESPMGDAHWKSGKTGYDWKNYAWGKGFTKFAKYCPTDKADYWDAAGNPDNILELTSADDAATKELGAPWRMPTSAEWDALLKAADFTWAWVTNYNNSGKDGRLVISRKSSFAGNCIFLPAAGFREDIKLYSRSDGSYWSSSLYTDQPCSAYALLISSVSSDLAYDFRYYGQSVRAVK